MMRDPEERPRPRIGARARRSRRRRAVLTRAIRQIPDFLRMMAGLLRDRRVDVMDKILVAAAIAYVALPADLVLDYIPFLGMVDDVFVLATTVRRLLRNAGFKRATRYWPGDPADLRRIRVEEIIEAAALFLPRRARRKLRRP